MATLTAELTRAGIDARREDGSPLLVAWSDVVGVVVKRLPNAYDGATIVDVVSTAGSTLRILPSTKLTGGDSITGDDADRARGVASLIRSYCPACHLDAATRSFLDGSGPAAQLLDVAALAAYDQRLA